ncbi:MAG: FAD:protein FMN transferase [Chthoniobacterales bacterium]
MTGIASVINTPLAAAGITECADEFYEIDFYALGSQCQLIYEAENLAKAEAYHQAAGQWLGRFEARYSRFQPDSEVCRVNAMAGIRLVEIDAEFEMLLDLCEQCHFVTQGAFDATSLPLSLLWDWKRKRDSLPTEEEIAQARSLVGWLRVERSPGRIFLPQKGMMLDLGGVGKEFAVDCLRQLAVGMGITNIMVNLGGDIAVLGESYEAGAWYVGLEDPARPGETYCGLRLRSGTTVATSGDYRRRFEFEGRSYGHVLDCRSGWPVANGTKSATVIANRCTAAGLLSTSALVLGGQNAIAMLDRTQNVEGCLWCDGKLYETRGFRRSILPKDWFD